VLNRNTKTFITYYDLIYVLAINMKLESHPCPQNEFTEHHTLTDFPRTSHKTGYACPRCLTANSLTAQSANSNPVSTETANSPHEKDAPECAHEFGYITSGDRIPEECLTCPNLLKCLTKKDHMKEA
jgi:hypothetical protein